MKPPSLASTIRALTLTHPQLGKLHTDEEADVAEALRHVEDTHRGGTALDDTGHWGTCSACRKPWPCPTWTDAEADGLLYLGRAHDRVAARARQTLDRLAARDAERRTA